MADADRGRPHHFRLCATASVRSGRDRFIKRCIDGGGRFKVGFPGTGPIVGLTLGEGHRRARRAAAPAGVARDVVEFMGYAGIRGRFV